MVESKEWPRLRELLEGRHGDVECRQNSESLHVGLAWDDSTEN